MPRLMVADGIAFRMARQPKKQLQWGGARKGAGRPKTGVTKVRLCISVDKKVYQRALDKWIAASHRGKTSQLVEWLLDSYVNGQG